MTLITLPSSGRWSDAAIQFTTADSALEFLNGSEQIISTSNKKWSLSFNLKNLSPAETRFWRAAITQLCDLNNVFHAPPPEFNGPASGYAGANPTVDGSSQLGKSLNIKGATASTLILMNGDYFTVNGELKFATADVTTDGLGNAVLPFHPALRTAPLNNEPVIIDAPYGIFRLLQPISKTFFDATLNGSCSIQAIETYSP